ncbi:MAG TPA: serine/threonine-protein kinase [Planctomycetota bacterium]|nr:serine/threonine-protein kinase [Planctomycetota bacterium]
MSGPDPLDLPERVLDEALAKLVAEDGEHARRRALDELVVAHPEHRDELAALHESIARAGRVLARTFATAPAEPERVDAYRVVRRLGEGAFGVVYLAEQDEPIRREVAIKVLRPGAGDRGTLLRFAAERQLLATFKHPAIAGILDAGALPDGRPWFAMEYVDGTPITRWCDEQRLPLVERLQLFAAVCDAVAHAHSRGVVHRDLKPANVLVTRCDGRAMPKVIDFGVAKALHASAAAGGADATATGRVVGTPGYMSPEQQGGDHRAVDARTDVFALGVILYELLTGALPWPRGTSSTTAGPVRPSTRVSGERGPTVASARATETKTLAQRLRGELDWIVLAALHHERERRYPDAQALGADLRRYLADEPVQARPPSWRYRLRKLAQRRRAAIVATLALVLAAAGGVAASLSLGEVQASEQDRIAAIDQAATLLLQRAFDMRLEDATHGDAIRQEVLRDALSLQDRALATTSGAPSLRGKRVAVLNGLANLWFEHARYSDAIALAREAGREAQALLSAPDLPIDAQEQQARSAYTLARCHFLLGQRADAANAADQAVAGYEALQARDSLRYASPLASALVVQASTRVGPQNPGGELAAQQRAIDVLEAFVHVDPEHAVGVRDLIRYRCGLAAMLAARADTAGAWAAAQAARTLAEQSPLATDDERGIVHRRLALLAAGEGDTGAAIEHWTRAVEFCERASQQHPARHRAREMLHEAAFELTRLLYGTSRCEAAAAMAARAIGAAEAFDPGLPNRDLQLARTIAETSNWALSAQHFECYELLDARLARVAALLAGNEAVPARAIGVKASLVHALVRADLGRPVPVGQWAAIVESVKESIPDWLGYAQLGFARRQRECGDLAGAAASLQETRATRLSSNVVAERMRQALAAGDAAAAVAAADEGLAADATWPMQNVAAAGLFAAVRQAGASADAGWKARAIAVQEQVLAALVDAPALPERLRDLFVAQGRVRLALLRDTSIGLADGTAMLDRLRGNVEATSWDEALWTDACAASK